MRLEDVRARLADLDAAALDPPAAGRIGATLVLLRPTGDGEVEVTYTRRQPTLSSHPGQISFPGGRVDPGEGIVEAALREAEEEIGLDPASAVVAGRLPAFYIPPSRFWMSTVVALWDRPHPLVPNDAEVAEVLHVSSAVLREPARWRAVPLTVRGTTWAWQLARQQLLWGATAVVTGVLLDLLDPGWSGGTTPESLPAARQVRPWEDPDAAGLAPAPARARPRLVDVAEEQVALGPGGGPTPDAATLAAHVAEAVRRLARRGDGPVVVLVGTGRTGRVARAAAATLRAAGEQVEVLDRDGGAAAVADAVVRAGVVVDGVLGRGFDPPLRGWAEAVVAALPSTGAPLVAVDLPSGVDARDGLVGPAASADVTVAAAPTARAHDAAGVLPFLGDLYLSREGAPLVRVGPASRAGVWAE